MIVDFSGEAGGGFGLMHGYIQLLVFSVQFSLLALRLF